MPEHRLDMAICSIGKHGFDEVCIAYALDHDQTVPARVRPQFLTLEDALRRRQPFVVLMLVYMGPTTRTACARNSSR